MTWPMRSWAAGIGRTMTTDPWGACGVIEPVRTGRSRQAPVTEPATTMASNAAQATTRSPSKTRMHRSPP
jgi:hypothetical protein